MKIELSKEEISSILYGLSYRIDDILAVHSLNPLRKVTPLSEEQRIELTRLRQLEKRLREKIRYRRFNEKRDR